MNENKDFATIITNLRTKYNYTQKQFADLLKVSDRTVSKWERGVSVPDLTNIKNICEVLDIPPSDLVDSKYSFKEYLRLFTKRLGKVIDYIIKNIFAIGFIIVFIILLLYFVNNFNSINMYSLRINDDSNIRIDGGTLINSKKQNILFISGISLLKVDYEIDSINLELYTYVNGDKFVIYESNNLDSIYIDELNYKSLLNNDTIESIKKKLFLEIKITKKDNKNENYTTNIDLYKNYSNDRIIQKNRNYIQYNNDSSNSIYNENGITSNKYTSLNDNSSSNNSISKKLTDLGFKYDEDKKEYYLSNSQDNIYYRFDELLEINNKNKEYVLKYYINNNNGVFRQFDKKQNPVSSLKFYISNNINCTNEDCKKNNKVVNDLYDKYKEIFTILL